MERARFIQKIQDVLDIHPVCGILGPRQCGKTTLAKQFIQQRFETVHQFDLENPDDLNALSQPLRILERLTGLVVIDEIQRLPELFPILRVLSDKTKTQYLILGSASRELIQQSSETLAGRIGYIELTPFQLIEGCGYPKLLTRGGFPKSYLAKTDDQSYQWRQSYIQTFLERDIPNLGFSIPPMLLRRFWLMLTHVHGQMLTVSSLATSLAVSTHKIRHYLDILTGTFMIRVLPPWFENLHKRQVKTPKIFFKDTGILLALLTIRSEEEWLRHPKLGQLWEGFALEQVIQSLSLAPEEAFFWRTQNGAEIDLFTFHRAQRLGFEFKFTDTPKITKSMNIAVADLGLNHLYVIYPGDREIVLDDRITGVGLNQWLKITQTHKKLSS